MPSHQYPNLASLETNQDSLFPNFLTQLLVIGSPLKFFIFKFKNYPWFKDSTHYYWPVPTNYTCLDRNKNANAPDWAWMTTRLFSLSYIWGDFCEVKSKLLFVLQNKTKMPTFPKVTKAPLPSQDRQEMYKCCYFTATSMHFVHGEPLHLTWYN